MAAWCCLTASRHICSLAVCLYALSCFVKKLVRKFCRSEHKTLIASLATLVIGVVSYRVYMSYACVCVRARL